eukprot:6214119-Pleurochrysis_carterae.AAC.1
MSHPHCCHLTGPASYRSNEGSKEGECDMSRAGGYKAKTEFNLYVKCVKCPRGNSRTCLKCLDLMASQLEKSLASLKKTAWKHPIWDAVAIKAWYSPEKSYGCLSYCPFEQCVMWTDGCPCCYEDNLPAPIKRSTPAYKASSADLDPPYVLQVDVAPVLSSGADGTVRPFSVEVVRAYQVCSSKESSKFFRAAHYRESEHGKVKLFHSPPTGVDCRLLLGMGCCRDDKPSEHNPHCLSFVLFDALRECNSPQQPLSVVGIGNNLRLAATVRGDGCSRENLCRSALKGRRKQDAPPLHQTSFRARRSGGSAGVASGSLSSWRELWCSPLLEGALPRKVIWLVPLYDPLTNACTELLPIYMSPRQHRAIVLDQSRYPPRAGSDISGTQVKKLLQEQSSSDQLAASTGVSLFLKEFTAQSLTAARILAALAEADPSCSNESAGHAQSMLARWTMCLKAAGEGPIRRPSTRSLIGVDDSGAPDHAVLLPSEAAHALTSYSAAYHLSSVYTPLAGHIDQYSRNAPGLQNK